MIVFLYGFDSLLTKISQSSLSTSPSTEHWNWEYLLVRKIYIENRVKTLKIHIQCIIFLFYKEK